jgi:hypothetical protein
MATLPGCPRRGLLQRGPFPHGAPDPWTVRSGAMFNVSGEAPPSARDGGACCTRRATQARAGVCSCAVISSHLLLLSCAIGERESPVRSPVGVVCSLRDCVAAGLDCRLPSVHIACASSCRVADSEGDRYGPSAYGKLQSVAAAIFLVRRVAPHWTAVSHVKSSTRAPAAAAAATAALS